MDLGASAFGVWIPQRPRAREGARLVASPRAILPRLGVLRRALLGSNALDVEHAHLRRVRAGMTKHA